MTVPHPIHRLRSIISRQKFGEKDFYGSCDFGSRKYGGLFDASGIYRVRHYKGKIYHERMDFYAYVITHTEQQNVNRAKYKAGYLAWRALSDSVKAEYDRRAIGRHYKGYHLFMKEYLS